MFAKHKGKGRLKIRVARGYTYEDNEQVAEDADEEDEALKERSHDPVVARIVRRIAEHVVVEARVTRIGASVWYICDPFRAVPRVRLVRQPVPVWFIDIEMQIQNRVYTAINWKLSEIKNRLVIHANSPIGTEIPLDARYGHLEEKNSFFYKITTALKNDIGQSTRSR